MVTSCTQFLLKITQSEMQVRLDIGWDMGYILAKTFRLERIVYGLCTAHSSSFMPTELVPFSFQPSLHTASSGNNAIKRLRQGRRASVASLASAQVSQNLASG